MSVRVDQVESVTISSGNTNSDETIDVSDFHGASGFLICGPSALAETVTVQVSFNNSTFYVLQSGGSDVVISAGDAVPIDFQGWKYMRLSAGSAVAADRVFEAGIIWED